MKGDMVKTNFNVPVNLNRQQRKKERGFGKLAMGNMTLNEWCKMKDPLFNIKGMERKLKTQKSR